MDSRARSCCFLFALFAPVALGVGSACKRKDDKPPPSKESPAALHLADVAELKVPTSTSKEPAPAEGIAVYVTPKAVLFGEDRRELFAIDDQATLAVGGFGVRFKAADGTPLSPLVDAVTDLRKKKELGEWVPAALVIDEKTPFRAIGELFGTVQRARFERMALIVRNDGKLTAITLTTGVRPPPPLPDAPKVPFGGPVPKGANVSLGLSLNDRGAILRAFGRPVGPGCAAFGNTDEKTDSLAPTVPLGPSGHDFAAIGRCARVQKDLAEGTHDDRVSVTASPATEWATVVHALDAVRDDEKGKLFPEVSFVLVH